MRVAVVGCGAVGSFYGAKLARAGHTAYFVLRSDYEAVRREGVRVQSSDGDFEVRPVCARRPEEVGPVDLVLIGLKTTANDELPRLLPPLVGPGTAALTLQNGLGNEEKLARLLPVEQIMGGLCFVCLNRVAPGVVRHIRYGEITLGEFQRASDTRTQELARRFREAGVPCTITENLARAHWEKLVWNVPFNGLGVAGAAGPSVLNAHPATPACCLTTDLLLADSRWGQLVRELMSEVIAAARALGHDMPDAVADERIARTRTMGAYKASTLIDFERGQPLELESLFREPLRQAAAAGVATPRLAELCAVLEGLEHRHHVAG